MHLSYSSPPILNFLHVCSDSPVPHLPTLPEHTHPIPYPSPLHTHTLPGWVVCCMGHWCDMHLSLQNGYTPFPTSLLPPPSFSTCSMSAQSPPPILVLLTITPSPLTPTPYPSLFSLSAFRDQPSVSLCYVPLCEEGIV